MTEDDVDEIAFAAVAMAALVKHGIPKDIVELLLRGDAKKDIPSGAIIEAVKAILEQIEIHKRQS